MSFLDRPFETSGCKIWGFKYWNHHRCFQTDVCKGKIIHFVAAKNLWLKRPGFTLLILPKIFDPDELSYLSGALDSQYAAG